MIFGRTWQLASTLAVATAAGSLWVSLSAAGQVLAFDSAAERAVESDAGRLAPPPGVQLEVSPLEARLFAAAAQGRTDRRWLLTAICAASGEQDEACIARRAYRVDACCAALRRQLAEQRDDRGRAEAALDYLYREILHGGYHAEATDLARALEGGDYNCVSSTVLFHCLAEGCELAVSAVETPGHVFAVIESPAGPLDVETTCRNWFQSPDLAAQANRTGVRRRLSAAGLVALVYYNRGVDLLSKHRFAEAIIANLKALQLDPQNGAARGNWLAGVNNWALAHNGRNEFARAVTLLRYGLLAAPDHRPFRINFVAVHQRWVEALLEQQEYALALDALHQASRDLPEETYFAAAAAEIERRAARRSAVDGLATRQP